jgi:phage terminase large subunit GpA-like protein
MQRLRGRPCRYVWLSEVAVYGKGYSRGGDPVAAAHQRVKAFFRGFIYQESSPSEHPCRITELEEQASARYRWQVACPHCGAKQELRFFARRSDGKGGIGGIRDAGGELVSPDLARDEAHYVCTAGCRIDDADKQRMLEAGEMQKIGERGDGPEKGSRRKLGFQLWSAHSESIRWGDIAAAYVEARNRFRLPEYFGNWLGLEYRPETRVPQWQQLGNKNAWTNSRWRVPREAWFLSAGVDVQQENNGCRVSVRGWAPGRTSFLVGWMWIERDLSDLNDLVRSDLAAITREILEPKFQVVDEQGRACENPLGRRELAVKLLGIDVGHDPRAVSEWLKSLPESWTVGETPRVRAFRGDHQLSTETRWQVSQWQQNVRTGEKYDGGLTVWRLYVYPFYETLLSLLQAEPGKPGGFHVTADALAVGKAYLEQVVNFGRTVELDEKTGLKKVRFGPRNRHVPVDFFDTELYSLVAAEMVVGDLGWATEAWEGYRSQLLAAAAKPSAKNTGPRGASLTARDCGGLDDR